MTRRVGRTRAGVLWLGVVLTLFGGASACGDGEDTPNGTSGASGGGMRSGSGGLSGTGGSRTSGGSSGAAPKGGSGGSSGSGASGAGGTPFAGEGGLPGEGSGGVGPTAGGGTGGGVGPTAGNAGGGTDGGVGPTAGNAGAGTDGGTDAGASGGAALSVEYRSCERGAAITRIDLYRIDRALGICTVVLLQQGQINCLDGLQNGAWCVIDAALSADVGACESLQPPSDVVQATAGIGTFTVSVQPLSVDIDVDFDFPDSGTLPQSVSVEATNCLADCSMNDCRP